MTITESKIAGRGYYGTLPKAEGEGADLAARYYDAMRTAVTELFTHECEVPHTSCTCGFTVTERDGTVTVTVTLRRRTGGKTTAERTLGQVWNRENGLFLLKFPFSERASPKTFQKIIKRG